MMKTILLIEDDDNLNKGISLKLRNEGYFVLSAADIKEAKRHWATQAIDMVISDITLPDGSGLDFGRKVREESNAYLLYLTAQDEELDIINGYDTGADDYITKPFSVNALVAKVNAFMRRLEDKDKTILISDDLEVSVKKMQVKKQGEIIALSKTEILLLIYLLENANQIVLKESILEHVWGVEGLFVEDNTVTVNISRLKTKLETDAISNVRGLGYVWTKEVIRK